MINWHALTHTCTDSLMLHYPLSMNPMTSVSCFVRLVQMSQLQRLLLMSQHPLQVLRCSLMMNQLPASAAVTSFAWVLLGLAKIAPVVSIIMISKQALAVKVDCPASIHSLASTCLDSKAALHVEQSSSFDEMHIYRLMHPTCSKARNVSCFTTQHTHGKCQASIGELHPRSFYQCALLV